MSDEESEEYVLIKSKDEEVFKIKRSIAMALLTVKNIFEDLDSDEIIPLPLVDSKTLTKVIEYATFRAKTEQQDIKDWERNYLNLSDDDLFQLILAANYLDIKPLLDITCMKIANQIKGKTPEQIRTRFNIKNDFTPEEEAEIQKENAWCQES